MPLAGVVLAAGAGTRLRPLTELRPKALCPVGNVPLLDLALDRLRPLTGDALAVNAHHHADQVVAHVAGRAHVSVEGPEALGTAGALGALRDWLDGRDVLLTNADSFLPTGLAGFADGWDGKRMRLLCLPAGPGRRGDFVDDDGARLGYVGACLLPWGQVEDLAAEPSGLYEVRWRAAAQAGELDLVVLPGTLAVDCGTPADYLAANLLSSGGASVVAPDAVVEGSVERCVVWTGAFVEAGEKLVDAVRAGSREHPVTVSAPPVA